MPSFVCDYCQETLKKAKLDQHAQRCRQSVFSCIDCHTNFKGTEYRAHFSCITEVQKYHQKQPVGAKTFEAKTESKPVAKAESKPVVKAESKSSKKSENKSPNKSTESDLSSVIKKLFTSSSPPLSFKVVKKQLKKSLGKNSKKTLQENIKFSLNNETGELVIKLE